MEEGKEVRSLFWWTHGSTQDLNRIANLLPKHWGNTCDNETPSRYVAAALTIPTSNYLTFGGSDCPGATAIQVRPYPHRSTMGGKRFHRLRARQFPCPYCGKRFADVLRHLNHRESKCTTWFTLPPPPTRSTFPPPPEFMDDMDDRLPFTPTADSELPGCTTPNRPQPFRTEFPTAGKIYGCTKSFIDRFHDDKYTSYRTQNPYYPFADREEWELGSFLLGSGMSMRKVDEFLRLKLVFFFGHLFTSLTDSIQIKDAGITFNTTKGLQSRIEMLPSVPDWKYRKITLTGHVTKEPMLLFYRDALDCVEYLFGNPIFSNKIDFCPV